MNRTTFDSLDLIIIGIYLFLIFIVALKSGKISGTYDSGDEVNNQYLAGQSLTFLESLCSIIATEVSALTFLGIPAIAFAKDYSFIQVYFGAILGRIIIAKVILPRVYGKGLTLYEIMAKGNGTVNGQRFTSLMFFITKLFSIGVRLFSGSILVAAFFNLNIYFAVFIICVFTFFYTLIGGLKAVVRTDMMQMCLFVLGGLVAHYLIPDVSGNSWSNMMTLAFDSGKMDFISFSNPWPFIIGIFGGVLFDTATHGVDQDFIQRLMGNQSLKSAQRAIMVSVYLSITVAFIFLGVGSLLWAHYQVNPLPTDTGSDQLFAVFITSYFPAGLKGLMVAGILAATMSTLDSTINALCSCFYNDILPGRKKHSVSFYYKIDTLMITFLLMLVAFLASTSDGLLMLGLKIASWTSGPLLALFAGTKIFKGRFHCRLDFKTVAGAYILGCSSVALNTFVLKWPWHANTYLGFSLAIVWILIITKKQD
jgi:SSS family solute:Na+ symporter